MGYNWNWGNLPGEKKYRRKTSTLRDRAKNQRQHILVPHICFFPSFLTVVFGRYGFSKFSKFHNEYPVPEIYTNNMPHIYGYSNGCIGM